MDKKTKLYYGAIALLTIFAFILRILFITYSKLWIDELYCFDIANHASVFEVVKTTLTTDLHAPLFFVILHFWIKIFGSSDIALMMLPVLFSTACIPVGALIAEKLFDRKTAIIFAAFCTFSALEINYSQEVKFYSMLPLLGLFCAYYFVQTLQKPKLKNFIPLVISNIILIYTFNLGVIFSFVQFVTGLLYLLAAKTAEKKESVKNFVLSFCSIFILYLPYFYFQIKTMASSKSGICSLFNVFHFDLGFVNALIQNFFTPVLDNLGNNSLNYSIFENIKELHIIGVIIFIILFLLAFGAGFIISIKENKTKSLLLISISVLFIVSLMLLAQFHIIPLITRYCMPVHLILMLCACAGLAKLNKKILYPAVIILILISAFYLFSAKNSAITRNASFHYYAAKAIKQENIKDTDYILMPYFGRFLYKYLPEGRMIDYRLEDLLMKKNPPLFKETFNLSIRDDGDYKLSSYVSSPYPPYELEEYFVKNYFSKMKKGERLFFVESYLFLIIPDNLYPGMLKNLNVDNKNLTELEKTARYCMLYTKILKNLEIICSKHLKYLGTYYSENQDIKIYAFEKI